MSMSYREAIECLEELQCHSSCESECDALEMAIAALEEKEETDKPLTLEQLREMDGKPVYLKIKRHPHLSGWYIAQCKNKIVRLLNFSGWVNFVETEMIAYAYHPAHIDRKAGLDCDNYNNWGVLPEIEDE